MGGTTTPTAAPCLLCFSTGGRIPKGKRGPYRVQGLCSNCHSRCWKRMKSHGLPDLAAAIDLDELSPRPAPPPPSGGYIVAPPRRRDIWEGGDD